jgi:hypothetical protein
MAQCARLAVGERYRGIVPSLSPIKAAPAVTPPAGAAASQSELSDAC